MRRLPPVDAILSSQRPLAHTKDRVPSIGNTTMKLREVTNFDPSSNTASVMELMGGAWQDSGLSLSGILTTGRPQAQAEVSFLR